MNVLFTIELRVACDDDNNYVLAKHMVQQGALQLYARTALLDDAERPQLAIYSHDYENGHRDIPVGEFTSQHHATIAAISAQLSAVLPTGCRTRTPVLRLIEGGRAPD